MLRLMSVRGVAGLGSRRLSSGVSEEFRVERLSGEKEGIVVFRMNRPKAMNAISKSLLASFWEAINEVKFDRRSRVIIIKSDVKGAFCAGFCHKESRKGDREKMAGADLKERARMTPEEVPAFVNRARGLMSELEALPQPVIAALDGVALGGGLEMALAADLRVASARARLGLTETRLAIIPGAGGTQRLPRLIGPAKAKELIFTARIVGGAEAAELGLVNRLADGSAEDAAYEAALEMAVEILPNGPIALKAAKLAINQGSEVDLASALQTEMLCYQMVIPTKDRLEALSAFKEKRKPQFKGH